MRRTGQGTKHRGARAIRGALASGLLALAACGGDELAPPEMRVVTDAPVAGSQPGDEVAEVAVGAAVRAVGAGSGGVWVGTQEGVRLVAGGVLAEVELPAGTDASAVVVQAMTRRDGELLLASPTGLFETTGDALRPSPAGAALAGLEISAMSWVDGEPEELWVGAKGGLYRIRDGQVTRYAVGEEAEAPSALSAGEGEVLVAYGPRLYAIRLADEKAEEFAPGLGAIHALARDGGVAYVATDAGLCARDAEGAFTLYTLGEGEAPAVTALAPSPGAGVYASVPSGVVAVRHGEAPVEIAALPASEPATSMALDGSGGVWVASGSSVRGLQGGKPVVAPSFAKDLVPIFEKHCTSCHVDGQAPPIDFRNLETVRARADRIAERIEGGEMPPPPKPPVEPDEFEIFVRWVNTGKEP